MLLDFSTQTQYLWALLPETVLAVWAMLVLLVDVFQKGERGEPSRPMIAWLTFAGVLVAGFANAWLLGVQESGTAGMIAIDAFRVFTNFIFLLAAALFVLISRRYLARDGIDYGELYALLLLATVGMMTFAGSRDLLVIFLGLELMSIAIYVLTGINRRDRRSAEAALKYFLLGAFSSAIFLFGIALIFGTAQSTNLAVIAEVVGVDGLGASPLLLVGMVLLIAGFAFKVAAVPFHMWTPDAYDGAPTPVAAFMAAAVKAAAFAAFLRVFLTAFPGLHDTWGQLIGVIAVVTMIAANLVATVQGNVKRMLAYSSVAHAGYLLVALAAASTTGAASFLFYLVVYTLMTIGAFAVVLVVARPGDARVDIDWYAGLGWERPLLGTAMTVFLLSLAGFPFTGGFIGKLYILRAALEKGMLPLAVVLVMASLVSYFYYLRVAWYMWFREAPDSTMHSGIEVAPALRFALVVAVIGILWLGIFPGGLLELAERSTQVFAQAPGAVLTLTGR